jgi:hypothetical protein
VVAPEQGSDYWEAGNDCDAGEPDFRKVSNLR